MKLNLASDLVTRWVATMTGELEAAVAAEAARNGVDLADRGFTARGLAELYWDALEGMKARVQDTVALREGMRAMGAVLARAVG